MVCWSLGIQGSLVDQRQQYGKRPLGKRAGIVQLHLHHFLYIKLVILLQALLDPGSPALHIIAIVIIAVAGIGGMLIGRYNVIGGRVHFVRQTVFRYIVLVKMGRFGAIENKLTLAGHFTGIWPWWYTAMVSSRPAKVKFCVGQL